MKKTTDEELNIWRYQYPTAIVSMRVIGNPVYARQFFGEGKALLHNVINAMKFNKLGQFQDEWRYADGSVVRARSVFGQNTIEIDVSKSIVPEAAIVPIAKEATCTITLIDVSHFVQPMRYPGEIHAGEVENKDYLKIYYQIDVSECKDCSDIQWDVIVKDCTYSLEHSCWGQVFDTGEDSLGKFILVKFFTERMIFSRTGLSAMTIKGWIDKPDKTEACKIEEIINVSCCEKDAGDRLVIMYWNYQCNGCEVPAENSISAIAQATEFYAQPKKDGGCIPYTWFLEGPGSIQVPDPEFNTGIIYHPPESFDCGDEVWIRLLDRCGVVDIAYFKPCCDAPSALAIGYTSLGMSCNAQQTLTAIGGCPPYSWAITGGGGSLDKFVGQSVVYTSPSTNPNCGYNPTIQLTDCCGTTAQISLAVNCYADGIALHNDEDIQTGWIWDPANVQCKWQGAGVCDDYDCNGNIVTQYHFPINALMVRDPGCAIHVLTQAECDSYGTMGPHMRCADGGQFCAGPWGFTDVRTQDMKDQGCCLLNPLTGLPY